MRQRNRPRINAIAVLKAIEPAFGDGVDAVTGAGESAENGAAGVGIAAEIDDLGEGLFKGVGGHQEIEAGGDAGRRKAHRRAPADRIGPVAVGFGDERRKGLFRRKIQERLGMSDGTREAAGVAVEFQDLAAETRRRFALRP